MVEKKCFIGVLGRGRGGREVIGTQLKSV